MTGTKGSWPFFASEAGREDDSSKSSSCMVAWIVLEIVSGNIEVTITADPRHSDPHIVKGTKGESSL